MLWDVRFLNCQLHLEIRSMWNNTSLTRSTEKKKKFFWKVQQKLVIIFIFLAKEHKNCDSKTPREVACTNASQTKPSKPTTCEHAGVSCMSCPGWLQTVVPLLRPPSQASCSQSTMAANTTMPGSSPRNHLQEEYGRSTAQSQVGLRHWG